MSTSSPPRRNSRTERIIAWTILLLVLAVLGAFMAHFAWMAMTCPPMS